MDNELRHYDVRIDDAGARNPRGVDRRAFQIAIQRTATMSQLQLASEVLSTGPIADADVEQSVAVYRRGLAEVARFLNGTNS